MSQVLEIQGQYYILASSSLADGATRVLKHDETFAIFDRHGDIRPLGFETQGLFHEGTRFVSRIKLELNGHSPLLLSSNVKEDNDLLVCDLTNPDLTAPDGTIIRSGTIHLVRSIYLWQGRCFQRTEISNFGLSKVEFTLTLAFESDFIDLFELRGSQRAKHGVTLEPQLDSDGVVLRYEGLDGLLRRTEFKFGQSARQISSQRAEFAMALEPQERVTHDLRLTCSTGPEELKSKPYDVAFLEMHAAVAAHGAETAHLESANDQFNDWLLQSHSDLAMLLSKTEFGLYPYAGIPWFSCPFGRDGIITALETLWLRPEIARGVLSYLTRFQATQSNPAQDCDPGKILHEQRKGEMAALGEIPFGSYYGTIDATPLYIVLAGRYYERTADRDFLAELWPGVERALEWMERFGDRNGDGFIDYCRYTDRGLSNQGWKDSEDSVFHSDGSLATAPIALCEVQGYAYEARLVASNLAGVLGLHKTSRDLNSAAHQLKETFHRSFWCPEIQTYALALDGEKRPCSVRSSNAGHCLFSGIASPEHAEAIAKGLLSREFFSGWGIRTIAEGEPRYNPMSYHNGSIWPHDNAIIAHGLARYGYTGGALRILEALFDASQFMDLKRLPELYCGFTRRPGEGPTLYPVACNPQAWASASVFFLLQSCLGLRILADRNQVRFEHPALPQSLPNLQIQDLKLPTGSVDIALRRHREGGVGVTISRRTGSVDVVVVH